VVLWAGVGALVPEGVAPRGWVVWPGVGATAAGEAPAVVMAAVTAGLLPPGTVVGSGNNSEFVRTQHVDMTVSVGILIMGETALIHQ
jgi:hypothetical protein